MATDLATRKSASTSDAYLQQQFAELCARIKRVDIVTHLLALALLILTYAFFIGCLDWFAGNSSAAGVQATRWTAYVIFLSAFGFLGVQTLRCCLRRVSPYFVAHQLERSVPGAKNSLINWLDLRDEGLPSAFRTNLSLRAAEQLEECDAEPMVRKRKNWILLGVLGVPMLGLAVLLLLGPLAFFGSMLRAVVPFYTPAPVLRTQLTLLEPGDAEVGPGQAVTFAAKIEGRVPTGKQAPTLHYRWNADDDFVTQPLQSEGTGVWSAQLQPGQLRAGVTYKITAGDAETPEHQVRTRARAHVRKLDITYTHRPFRNLKPTTRSFPDEKGARPIIHGPVGSEVELTVHASRSVKSASVEVTTKAGKKELPIRTLPGDAFTCRFTLEQPGSFRIAYTTTDGEDNVDREAHSILVADDDAPKVVLTQPATDVSLPEDGTLELAGDAVSAVGIKSVLLHLRVVEGPDKALKLLPMAFREGESLRYDDGSYPLEVPYRAVVPLNQLKVAKGIHLLPPGTVFEYWLEATDSADYPQATGNVGRSLPFKVTLLPKAKDPMQEAINRKEADARQKKFDQSQPGKKKNGSGSSGSNSQQSLNQIEKEQQDANKKLNEAQKDKKDNEKRGGSKGADQQQNSDKKDGPQNSGQAPQPKPSPMSPPDDAGAKKDQGDGKGQKGESRDNGEPEKKKDDGSKGDKKEGSGGASTPGKDGGMGKQEPAGGARDGGPMGMNAPEQPAPKDNAGGQDAPMPSVKNAPKADAGPPQGSAKGIEQNGPEPSNKDQANAGNPQPPNAHDKSGKMNDPTGSGEAKKGPPDLDQSGKARGDEPKTSPRVPDWDDIARHIKNLPRDDKAGDDAGKAIALIAKSSDDPRKREIAQEALAKNGRDAKTGGKEKQKGPNPWGTAGKSPGISEDIKAEAANREFAARIGQMQLEDWKSRMTPDLLKKAGMSEADWQRYVKNQQQYDALVRQLNAQAARQALKDFGSTKAVGSAIRAVDGPAGNESLRGTNAAPPTELLDAIERAAKREKR